MFYDKLNELCKEHGVKMTNVVIELGMSQGNLSRWKNGVEPRDSIVQKFADYFSVPKAYFFQDDALNERSISKDEWTLIEAFRAADSKGRFRIIQVCMNELDAAEARRVREEERVSG